MYAWNRLQQKRTAWDKNGLTVLGHDEYEATTGDDSEDDGRDED
jgi:hypothetical protein